MIGGGGEHDDSNADDDSDALDGVLNLPDAYGAFSTMDGSGSDAAVVTAALSYAMLLLPPIDLQRAARVSRQWHAAALRAAWLVLRPTSPGRLHRVLLYSLRADIQPFSLSNFDAFAWVKSLDFSHLHAHNAVTYTNFVILVNHCRAMVSLDLSMCAWATDEVVAVIANALSLEFLNLRGCYAITGKTLQTVLQSLPLLKRLSLAGCTRISSLQQAFDDPVSPLSCIDLREIFSLVDINATLSKIFLNFRNSLERIYIPGHFLSSDGFFCLGNIRPCLSLKSLFIESSPNLTDTSLHYLSRHVQELESLSLRNAVYLTCPSIGAFLSHANLGRLSFVDLSHISAVDDICIKCLASTTAVLQSLNLTGCVKVTDQSLDVIGHAFPCLHSLLLAYTSVSANGIKSILKTVVSSHGLLLRLRKLSLSNCHYVLGTDVHNLARRCWAEIGKKRDTPSRLSISSRAPLPKDMAASPKSAVITSAESSVGGLQSPLSSGVKKSQSIINFGEIPLASNGALPGMVLPPRRKISTSDSTNTGNSTVYTFSSPDVNFGFAAESSSRSNNAVGAFLPSSSALLSAGSSICGSLKRLHIPISPTDTHASSRDSFSSTTSLTRSPNIPTPPPRSSRSSTVSLQKQQHSAIGTPQFQNYARNFALNLTECNASSDGQGRTGNTSPRTYQDERRSRSISLSPFGVADAARVVSRDRGSIFSLKSGAGNDSRSASRSVSRDRGSIFSFASSRRKSSRDSAGRVSIAAADGIKLEATWVEFTDVSAIARIRRL